MDKKRIDNILSKYANTFEALARQEEIDKLSYNHSINDTERDALYSLLRDKDELKTQVDATSKPNWEAYPPGIRDLYVNNFKEETLKALKDAIKSFNLTPEETSSIITEENVNNILGREFLQPPRKTNE